MTTTVDIPEEVLAETMRLTNARSEADGVIQALKDFNRRHRVEQVISSLGTSDTFMTYDELMAMREADKLGRD